MTLTIDISPEVEARLKQEATERGQSYEQVAKSMLEAISAAKHDPEKALADDWQALAYRGLWEVWDNDEDAVYDHL